LSFLAGDRFGADMLLEWVRAIPKVAMRLKKGEAKMIAYRRTIVRLLLVLTAFFLMGGYPARGDSVMPINKVPGQVESNARRLMHDLKKQGFEVARGYFKVWPIEQCEYTYQRMGLCFGNNPAAPYITFAVPPWPEEYVDPVEGNIFGPSLAGYNDIYRFDPREAVVILGQLPPPASYFGQQTYLSTRKGTYDEGNPRYREIEESLGDFVRVFFQQVPSAPGRYEAISSVSNPNNNVLIERAAVSAFGQIRHFIITPDKFMNKAVREAFARISVRDEEVFTEQIPSDMTVGLDEAADDFWNAIISRPQNSRNAPANHIIASFWKKERRIDPMSGARTMMMPGTRTRNGPRTRANARVRSSDSVVAGMRHLPLWLVFG